MPIGRAAWALPLALCDGRSLSAACDLVSMTLWYLGREVEVHGDGGYADQVVCSGLQVVHREDVPADLPLLFSRLGRRGGIGRLVHARESEHDK